MNACCFLTTSSVLILDMNASICTTGHCLSRIRSLRASPARCLYFYCFVHPLYSGSVYSFITITALRFLSLPIIRLVFFSTLNCFTLIGLIILDCFSLDCFYLDSFSYFCLKHNPHKNKLPWMPPSHHRKPATSHERQRKKIRTKSVRKPYKDEPFRCVSTHDVCHVPGCGTRPMMCVMYSG